ncbi:glycoside hydrolase family 16 protein [Pseudonocardia asaccharolytica]|uniref:GH16 domain-containing protein n=1 Tax=Pseudonocardia asaccharolytica DSM 44247 = NBRC 16224 TaxID=1123024 RepID=A0A511D8X2_9PSEU|nr:glycoside hydrolase family 16 protein [Pseudonocardia asaccharolytica]GEL20853.1 hypothetical protein PA7_46900 [Pseudonocardia asaccharolytica DSM 44247 = NBRC 16224]
MRRRLWLIISACAALLLTVACQPGSYDISVTGPGVDGSGTVIVDGSTSPPPTTDPTSPPPTTEPPPTAGDTTLTATPLDGQVRLDWTTTRTDITGQHISRDGTDTDGTGYWGTDLGPEVRTFTMDLLRPGDSYTFTLKTWSATEAFPDVTVTATPLGDALPPTTDPTSPPPTSGPPPPGGDQTEAAVKYGWGTPIWADEFNYTGAPDPSRWSVYGEGGSGGCWPGHAGNGRRCVHAATVNGSALVQTGFANGDSAGMAAKLDRQYGRWEARVKSYSTGPGSNTYHPLLLIWPTSDIWPEDGEYDFWENAAPDGTCAGHFIHYPHPNMPVQQEGGWCMTPGVDLGQWHNVAVEWTPEYIAGFIDGVEVYRYSGGAGPGGRSCIQCMPSGHLTIQLDNFSGTSMQPAKYEIDWVRVYGI